MFRFFRENEESAATAAVCTSVLMMATTKLQHRSTNMSIVEFMHFHQGPRDVDIIAHSKDSESLPAKDTIWEESGETKHLKDNRGGKQNDSN